MILRGIDFGSVLNVSGARGFFGETNTFYWQTDDEPDWRGATFTAKTTTLHSHPGHLTFKSDNLTPTESTPACIWLDRDQETVINDVGLSGPGLLFLLQTGHWQKIAQPFFVSFMPVQKNLSARIYEINSFVSELQRELKTFSSPFGLQLNISCPNSGQAIDSFTREAEMWLDVLEALDIPIVCKLNVLTPIEVALRIADHHACDALYISNTIPWGKLSHKINWQQIGQNKKSPLGGLRGGLSGRLLRDVVVDWLNVAQKARIPKPIIAGGGILTKEDAQLFRDHGATAVSLGVVSILHPERVRDIIISHS